MTRNCLGDEKRLSYECAILVIRTNMAIFFKRKLTYTLVNMRNRPEVMGMLLFLAVMFFVLGEMKW